MPNATVLNTLGHGDGSLARFTWALTTADPTGTEALYAEWADKTWAIDSASWGGATLTLQGSNDGTNWFTLANAAGGTALTFTSGACSGACSIETPLYVRPKLTTVGVGAVVGVTLLVRRATPLRT